MTKKVITETKITCDLCTYSIHEYQIGATVKDDGCEDVHVCENCIAKLKYAFKKDEDILKRFCQLFVSTEIASKLYPSEIRKALTNSGGM